MRASVRGSGTGLRGVAAGIVVAVVAAACSGGDSSSDDAGEAEEAAESAPVAEAELFETGDFYAAPDPLPDGEPGTLLRYQPVEGYDIAEAAAWRIMYLSESLEGEPIVVTGTALVPAGEAPPEGRKLLTISHGTTGLADECAPSKDPTRSELSLSGQFVEAGYVVAMSDYEGLGTPGRHPYLVGPSEGRSVLDAAKAATQLPQADVGDRYAIIGYSQGGHGALWANELAEDWGPDMELVGTVSGAPATEMPVIWSVGSSAAGGFWVAIVAGYEAAYPEADPALVMSPAGLGVLDSVDGGCIGAVFSAVGGLGGEAITLPDYAEAEPWVGLMEDNNPGQVATEEPVLVLHSAADATVPVGLSQNLFDRMCGTGQVVERRVYEQGDDHVGAVPDAYADGLAWIEGLMDGAAPISTCP